MSKNEFVTSFIAFVLLSVLGTVQQAALPFEHWKKVIAPLLVTYIILGLLIGYQKTEDIPESISSGFITGIGVYTIIYIWLYSVGFFKGTMELAVGQFTVSVFIVTITSFLTREINTITSVFTREKK